MISGLSGRFCVLKYSWKVVGEEVRLRETGSAKFKSSFELCVWWWYLRVGSEIVQRLRRWWIEVQKKCLES